MKNKKRSIVLIIAALLLFTAAVGTTIAFLTAESGPVDNTFNTAKMETKVQEGFDGSTKEKVYVENKGDVPVFVRVKVVTCWKDSSDNIVNEAALPVGYKGTVTTTTDSDKWILKDEIWYYTEKVDAEHKTDNLPCTWTAEYPENPEYTWVVTILSEAIQPQASKPDDYEAAWAVTK